MADLRSGLGEKEHSWKVQMALENKIGSQKWGSI